MSDKINSINEVTRELPGWATGSKSQLNSISEVTEKLKFACNKGNYTNKITSEEIFGGQVFTWDLCRFIYDKNIFMAACLYVKMKFK